MKQRYNAVRTGLKKHFAWEKIQNRETGGGGRPAPPSITFQVTKPLLELRAFLGVQITGLQSCDNDDDENDFHDDDSQNQSQSIDSQQFTSKVRNVSQPNVEYFDFA